MMILEAALGSTLGTSVGTKLVATLEKESGGMGQKRKQHLDQFLINYLGQLVNTWDRGFGNNWRRTCTNSSKKQTLIYIGTKTCRKGSFKRRNTQQSNQNDKTLPVREGSFLNNTCKSIGISNSCIKNGLKHWILEKEQMESPILLLINVETKRFAWVKTWNKTWHKTW